MSRWCDECTRKEVFGCDNSCHKFGLSTETLRKFFTNHCAHPIDIKKSIESNDEIVAILWKINIGLFDSVDTIYILFKQQKSVTKERIVWYISTRTKHCMTLKRSNLAIMEGY